MTSLLIASNNQGKVREYKMLLDGLPLYLTTPAQMGIELKVAETGSTYEENAGKKAVAYAGASGLVALADDSGLEVDALGGEPGVRAARYAGEGASDRERMEYLLSKLAGVPEGQRGARFKCVIVIAKPDGGVEICRGQCDGVIAFEPRGYNGFGYDPIFYLPELGKTMAELAPDIKNKISHRSKAAWGARLVLERMLKGGWV